jgi:hypothetical protein
LPTILRRVAETSQSEGTVISDQGGHDAPPPRTALSRTPSPLQVAARTRAAVQIVEDAEALLALTELHPRLKARQAGPERLTKLKERAVELEGALATRKAKKGEGEEAAAEAAELATRQQTKWASLHRLLRELAQQDERVRSLLRDAADRRT